MRINPSYRETLEALKRLVLSLYGDRLASLVIYGSVARGTAGPESDIDVLLVADPLPNGRLNRVSEFEAVEQRMKAELGSLEDGGFRPRISAVFKTREEAGAGSPLFLDMVEDAVILYDRDGFFEGVIGRLRDRLNRLGAKRVFQGERWYWVLKPDYRPGEVFEI